MDDPAEEGPRDAYIVDNMLLKMRDFWEFTPADKDQFIRNIVSSETALEYCERLTASRDRRVKPYFDYERYFTAAEFTDETFVDELAGFKRNVALLMEDQADFDFDRDVRIGCRHGKDPKHPQFDHKVSFRAWIQGYYVDYVEVPRLIDAKGLRGVFDCSCYTAKEQLIAMPLCCKGMIRIHRSDKSTMYKRDPRVLVPLECPQLSLDNAAEWYRDFVVSLLRGDERPLVLPVGAVAPPAIAASFAPRGSLAPSCLRKGKPRSRAEAMSMDICTEVPLDDDLMAQTVACLSATRSAAYDTWVHAAFAIGSNVTTSNRNAMFALWLEFSRKTDAGNFYEVAARNVWEEVLFKLASNRDISYRKLFTWAKADDPKAWQTLLETTNLSVISYLNEMDPRSTPGLHVAMDDKSVFCSELTDLRLDRERAIMAFVWAHMGSGKTEVALCKIKQLDAILRSRNKAPLRVLIVSPRVAHAMELPERYRRTLVDKDTLALIEHMETDGFELYIDHRHNGVHKMKHIAKFITTVESSHFLCGAEPYDIILVDEIQAVVNQFYSTTVKHRAACWDAFGDAIRNCRIGAVLMDACLTVQSTSVIEAIVGKSDMERKLIINPNQRFPRNFKVLKTDEPAKSHVAQEVFMQRVIEALWERRRIVVTSASKTFARALFRRIKQDPFAWDFVKDAHRFYSADSDDVQLKDDLKDVDAAWSPLNLLIYTPIFTVGNNFSVPNVFEQLFVYASANSVTGNNLLQSAFRVRNFVNTTVIVYIASRNFSVFPVSLAEIDASTARTQDEYRSLIQEYVEDMAMRGRQLIEFRDQLKSKYPDDPVAREREFDLMVDRIKERQDALLRVEADAPESLIHNYRYHVREVNMWRRYYSRMFKEFVIRMGHSYEEEVVSVDGVRCMKMSDDGHEYILAYLAFDPSVDIYQLEQRKVDREASETDKMHLQIYHFNRSMDRLKTIMPATVDQARRAQIFAAYYSEKRYALTFANILAEANDRVDVLMHHAQQVEGFFALADVVPAQRDAIARICDLLGITNTMDVEARISRRVIDENIEEFREVLAKAKAKHAFNVRARRKKEEVAPASSRTRTPFQEVLGDLNVIFRAWSDVELKDATDGSRSRKNGCVKASILRLIPGDFSAFFVV
jgi:hypothetical protein